MDFDDSAVMPFPTSTVAQPENRRQCISVEPHTKSPGPLRRHPVACPNPNSISPEIRQLHLSACVRNGLSQTMGHEKWRPHEIHELLVHDPAAVLLKTLSFYKMTTH